MPSQHPLITCQSIQKLDLEVVLKNEQLRHDLLFGAGLQFRVNSNPQKLVASNRYWKAIFRELNFACTCLNYNLQGEQLPTSHCICSHIPRPTTSPTAFVFPSTQLMVVITPSRLPSLLSELRDMLLYIIKPLPTLAPDACGRQQVSAAALDGYSKQETYLKSIFDPQLIEQELVHSSYDPSGLFRSVGDLLRQHCAPMRDAAIEAVVQSALQGAGAASACNALRLCFDLLEQMKLDITNHELKTTRAALVEAAIEHELSAFTNDRFPLAVTEVWLRDAHQKLSDADPRVEGLGYKDLRRTTQMRLCVLRGLTDTTFNYPNALLASPPTSSQRTSKTTPAVNPDLPETARLDVGRIHLLSSISIHTTIIALALLLYRQLHQARPHSSVPSHLPQVTTSTADTLALKKELWEIWSASIGHTKSYHEALPNTEQWRQACRDLVLHTVARLGSPPDRSTSASHSDAAPTALSVVDPGLVRLADRWADKNMRPDSALYIMLQGRLCQSVFLTAVEMSDDNGACSPRKLVTDSPSGALFSCLEPLKDEIRALSHRIAALSSIHTSIYLPLYEQLPVHAS